MGYDITISKRKVRDEYDYSEKKSDNEDSHTSDDDDDDYGENIVANLYMTYNHCQIFEEYDIYPREFNGKQIKDILPFYFEAFKKLQNDEEVIERIKENSYNDYDYSFKKLQNDEEVIEMIKENSYNDYDYSFKYDSNLLYEKTKYSVFLVVKGVIKKLLNMNQEYYWNSD